MSVLPSFRTRRNLCHPETHPVTQACSGGPAEKACRPEGLVHSHLCAVSLVLLCSQRHPCQVPLFSKGGHGPWVPSWILGRTPPCTDTCAALCRQSNRVDPRRPEKRGEADRRGLRLSLCTPTLQLIPLLLPPKYSEGYRQDRRQFHLVREWLNPRGPLDSAGAHSFMGHLPATQTKRGMGGEHPQRQARLQP